MRRSSQEIRAGDFCWNVDLQVQSWIVPAPSVSKIPKMKYDLEIKLQER